LGLKVKLLQVGKTDASWLREGIAVFEKRLIHYLPFSVVTVASPKYLKSLGMKEILETEGEKILGAIDFQDHVILCDEKGRECTSLELATQLKSYSERSGIQTLVFVIGGPYGFHTRVYDRANSLLSFSRLTFSHQMIRLLFVEQLYRSMTILKGEPYHHS